MFFFFFTDISRHILLVIISIRVFDEKKNYSNRYADRQRRIVIDILSIFLSKLQYFGSIFFTRKITDFVNNLLEKYLSVIPRFFFFFLYGRKMINRTTVRRDGSGSA